MLQTQNISYFPLCNISGAPVSLMGHAVAQLVEALSSKPEGAGSIPNGVIAIFHWHDPSGRTMALRLTQPLTEMSTKNIYWGVKAAGV